MFGFSVPRFVLHNSVSLLLSNAQLGFIPFHPLFIIRSFSSTISSNLNEPPFIVSYLVNSCGLSLTSAQSIYKNKRVFFETPERPDSVLRFFREHGFASSHISKIVKERPRLLLAKPEKILLPKVEFLLSLGVSRSGLPIMVSSNINLLARSLERFLIPTYEILKSTLVSDEKVVTALKRLRRIDGTFTPDSVSNNLSRLRMLGVSQSCISLLIIQCPAIIYQGVDRFSEGVKKVMELGFDPSKITFVEAIRVFYTMTQKTREHKMEVYRRCGFSEDEIWSIFRKHPICMRSSEEKIMLVMDFLVRKMGWQPAAIARAPVVLCCSLERRIMPRCSVVRVLLLKGLIKSDIRLSSVITYSEKRFLGLFVTKYEELVPQLLDLFHGKINLTELGFGFDEKSEILD